MSTCCWATYVYGNFFQLTINSIVAGSFYVLIAIGFNLIFRVTKFFNFTHGAVTAIGGHSVFYLISTFGFSVWLAAFLGTLFAGLVGFCLYRAGMESPLWRTRDDAPRKQATRPTGSVNHLYSWVDLTGFEPATSSVQMRRSTNWATGPVWKSIHSALILLAWPKLVNILYSATTFWLANTIFSYGLE